jgi:hypothetical protein
MDTVFLVLVLKEDGWHVKYDCKKETPTKNIFPTLNEAQNWVNEHFPENCMNCEINGYQGFLLPFDEWVRDVHNGGFIDYDGYGDVLDKDFKIIRAFYYPSDYDIKPEGAEYVLWYNK